MQQPNLTRPFDRLQQLGLSLLTRPDKFMSATSCACQEHSPVLEGAASSYRTGPNRSLAAQEQTNGAEMAMGQKGNP